MLRFAKITTLLLAGTLLLSSCGGKNTEEAPLTVSNNKNILNERVTIFERTSSQPVNAKGVIQKSMPATPDVNSITYDYILDGTFKPYAPESGKTYFLPEGESYVVSSLNMANNTYYIAGNMTVNGAYSTGATFIVLPEGTLNLLPKMPKGMKVYNYGTLNTAADFHILQGAELYTQKSLTFGSLKVEGLLYADEILTCDNLHIVQTNSYVEVDKRLEVKGILTIDNGANLKINHYLLADEIIIKSGGALEVEESCLVQAKLMNVHNPECCILVNGDEYTVFDIDEFIVIHQNKTKDMFAGWIDIHSEIDNRAGTELEWRSTIRFYGDTYIKGTQYRPEFGTPKADGEKEYVLDHIAEVQTPRNTLSATSIQFLNDKVYVSYHIQGDPYGGAIDVFELSTRQLLSNLNSLKTDYNHLIVEPSRIIVAGAEAKFGGLLGIVPLQNGTFSEATMEKHELVGSNGNCVIRNGSYLMTSSNRGFQTFDATNLSLLNTVDVPYAKHLNLNGDKYVAVHGTDDAQINVYDAADVNMTTALTTLQAGAINPTNGKNVCKLDGNRIYLCKGFNGLVVFENGSQIWQSENMIANGVDFDDEFIYVAGGRDGFLILDRNTFETVASYTFTTASANYVTALSDGYVYVAYGLRGSQLFRLIEK